MTKDEEQCLKLGQEVVRMIRDLENVTKGETGYARRNLTFPGGKVYMLIANNPKLADSMEAAATTHYNVESVRPPSTMD